MVTTPTKDMLTTKRMMAPNMAGGLVNKRGRKPEQRWYVVQGLCQKQHPPRARNASHFNACTYNYSVEGRSNPLIRPGVITLTMSLNPIDCAKKRQRPHEGLRGAAWLMNNLLVWQAGMSALPTYHGPRTG